MSKWSAPTALDVEDVIGRGYRGADWPLTLSFGVGSGLISIVIMLLYLPTMPRRPASTPSRGWLYAVPA